MTLRFLFLCPFLLLQIGTFSPLKGAEIFQIGNDCSESRTLNINEIYYSETAPKGSGEVEEFNHPLKPSTSFKKEHNTSWYQFSTTYNGLLGFDIIPDSIKDDYDFLVYKKSGADFCPKVIRNQLFPLRSCKSRNNKETQSITGLQLGESQNHVGPGPGISHASPINVKKGDEFGLVLDNCYTDGGAHTIKFYQYIPLILTGYMYTEDGGPVEKAWAIVEDSETGQRMDSARTDKNGYFRVKSYTRKGRKYELLALAQNHFFKLHEVTGVERVTTLSMDTLFLPKMEKGKNFVLNGLNFEPNSTNFVEGAEVKLKRLLEVMIRHPKLAVEIEGHANGAGNPDNYRTIEKNLSHGRAQKVRDFLISKGIQEKRVSSKGYGRERMLIPKAQTIEEKKINMRVEIKIISW